jgi:ankyrin repeat protein
MKNYMPVIKDGLILLVVSTLFVTVCNQFFKSLKKTGSADPMVTAIAQGNIGTVQAFLGEKGFDKAKAEFATLGQFQKSRANQADTFGRTPLMWVAYANLIDTKAIQELDSKRVPFADYLARNGAEINAQDKDGWTPLMWAAWSGLPQVATKLIELGASLRAVDRNGNTALTIAAQRGQLEIVKLLTDKGVDKSAAILGPSRR